jgi:hypothetical protein
MTNGKILKQFRKNIEMTYANSHSYKGGFDEILCYELHSQPINPRMRTKTLNNGFECGLTFKELAYKWGISVSFLGELIAQHCKKLEAK